MRRYGVNIDELAWKRASTSMTSGHFDGPMQLAVYIYCVGEWGGITDTYCRIEAAGEQYCGRIVSGLPPFSFKFAILPPIFNFESDSENHILDELILSFFLDIHKDL